MLLSLLLVLIGPGAVSENNLTIGNPQELIYFAMTVNEGTSYSGTTVFLESDILFTDELSRQFEPVGERYEACFLGTFDGQGHTITNLTIKSDSKYTGLFGYSSGISIKNVVVDSSCSVTSPFSSSTSVYIGGVIGGCQSTKGPCIIENTVNMATVLFSGNTSYGDLFIGGITGYLSSINGQKISVKNCVNYGSISHSGGSGTSRIGGIVGLLEKVSLYNCLNYGEISYGGSSDMDAEIGGIAGSSEYSSIENAVSVGGITFKKGSESIGSIAGSIRDTSFSYCFWSESIPFNIYGKESYRDSHSTLTGCTKFNDNFVLNKTVAVGKYNGSSLLEALNAYSDFYRLRDCSYWVINKGRKVVSFTINGGKNLSLSSQVIILPSLANDGKLWFDGWYTDSACTAPLKVFEVSTETVLYSKYGENGFTYTIAFDTRGGSPVEPIQSQYLTTVRLPNSSIKDRYGLSFWENELGETVPWDFVMPPRNLTLYAVWVPTRISTAEELVGLSKAVNGRRANYSGITVYLDSDIVFTKEFSSQFKPIGYFDGLKSYYFNGTFDGQGHRIKNLVINSTNDFSDNYSGLFGYSEGLTVVNVVIDKSCSIVPYTDSDYGIVGIGGIVGKCFARHGMCVVRDCVNEAPIRYAGDMSALRFGGIAGYFLSGRFESAIENCVNRGAIGYTGLPYMGEGFVGGILGEGSCDYQSKEPMVHVRDCVNHGSVSIRMEEEIENRHIGGIIGKMEFTEVKNCRNRGKVIILTDEHHDNTAVWVVVGIIIGVVIILAIVAVVVFMMRNRKRDTPLINN